ncbi:MAG: LysR family transcriptional regulator [Gemmatimonadota bacterium]|nr:LysR family transcriptional regulator [Gemmatimonadota bacterium]
MIAKSKLWIERKDGVLVLSDWRVDLLERIEQTGSLTQAAREMDVPYRTACYKLKQVECNLGVKLLEMHSGRSKGGSSRLSIAGRDYLEKYRDFREGFDQVVTERFKEIFE